MWSASSSTVTSTRSRSTRPWPMRSSRRPGQAISRSTPLAERVGLATLADAAVDDGLAQAEDLGERGERVADLARELARRQQHEAARALRDGATAGQAREQRQTEREGLAAAGAAATEHVAAGQRVGDRRALDGGGLGDVARGQRVHDVAGDAEVGEGRGGTGSRRRRDVGEPSTGAGGRERRPVRRGGGDRARKRCADDPRAPSAAPCTTPVSQRRCARVGHRGANGAGTPGVLRHTDRREPLPVRDRTALPAADGRRAGRRRDAGRGPAHVADVGGAAVPALLVRPDAAPLRALPRRPGLPARAGAGHRAGEHGLRRRGRRGAGPARTARPGHHRPADRRRGGRRGVRRRRDDRGLLPRGVRPRLRRRPGPRPRVVRALRAALRQRVLDRRPDGVRRRRGRGVRAGRADARASTSSPTSSPTASRSSARGWSTGARAARSTSRSPTSSGSSSSTAPRASTRRRRAG